MARGKWLSLVAALLVVVFPVVQTVAIKQAVAATAYEWVMGRAFFRAVAPMVVPGGLVLRIGTAVGFAYLLYKADAVAKLKDWWFNNRGMAWKSSGPDSWSDPVSGAYFELIGIGTLPILMWDGTDQHYHASAYITNSTLNGGEGGPWLPTGTVTGITEALAYEALNNRADSIIKGYFAQAMPGESAPRDPYTTDTGLPEVPDGGWSTGQGADLSNGTVYASPNTAMTLGSQNWNSVDVVWDNMTPNQENDFISNNALTNWNPDTGQQSASPLDNASMTDKENYFQNQRILETLEQTRDATANQTKELNKQFDLTKGTFGQRMTGLWGIAQTKFPFNMWTSESHFNLSVNPSETISCGAINLGAGVNIPVQPFSFLGDLPDKFRALEGWLVYAVTLFYIIRKAHEV